MSPEATQIFLLHVPTLFMAQTPLKCDQKFEGNPDCMEKPAVPSSELLSKSTSPLNTNSYLMQLFLQVYLEKLRESLF